MLSRFFFKQYSKLVNFYQHRFKAPIYEKKYREDFNKVPIYCFFIGYPRSGHTLIGSLLNAHPEVLISHELHVLDLLDKGVSRNRIFAKIIAQAKWFSARGERWTGYSYKVPGGYQGTYTELKVIGDKRGGASSRILYKNPQLLDQLIATIDKKIKVILIHRNPFDNITTRARGGNYYQRDASQKRLLHEIDQHFRDVETIAEIRKRKDLEFYECKHEDFLDQPQKHLENLCHFLEISAYDDYLEKTLKIIRKSRSQSRKKIHWEKSTIEKVQKRIDQYDFLKGYTFNT